MLHSRLDRFGLGNMDRPLRVLWDRLGPQEREIVDRCRTPEEVQRWLHSLAYNSGGSGRPVRSFRGVVRFKRAHCLEAALACATILEFHGYPPLLLDLESADGLDHVVFVFRRARRWGAVGKSRDDGLQGRRPVYRSIRSLAYSYYEPYVDDGEARITAYALADLRLAGTDRWRWCDRGAGEIERYLIDLPHVPLRTSDRRYRKLKERYRSYVQRTGNRYGTPALRGREHWI